VTAPLVDSLAHLAAVRIDDDGHFVVLRSCAQCGNGTDRVGDIRDPKTEP
jgi:hypothetical protein